MAKQRYQIIMEEETHRRLKAAAGAVGISIGDALELLVAQNDDETAEQPKPDYWEVFKMDFTNPATTKRALRRMMAGSVQG